MTTALDVESTKSSKAQRKGSGETPSLINIWNDKVLIERHTRNDLVISLRKLESVHRTQAFVLQVSEYLEHEPVT
jgi:hypothetical protein